MKVGDLVKHRQYGYGIVIKASVEGYPMIVRFIQTLPKGSRIMPSDDGCVGRTSIPNTVLICPDSLMLENIKKK